MNTTAGIFTVPVDGVYNFHFSRLKNDPDGDLFIQLQVNGVTDATSYANYLPQQMALSSISASLRH